MNEIQKKKWRSSRKHILVVSVTVVAYPGQPARTAEVKVKCNDVTM